LKLYCLNDENNEIHEFGIETYKTSEYIPLSQDGLSWIMLLLTIDINVPNTKFFVKLICKSKTPLKLLLSKLLHWGLKMLVHNTMCILNLKCKELQFTNYIVSSLKCCRMKKSNWYLENIFSYKHQYYKVQVVRFLKIYWKNKYHYYARNEPSTIK
jgi:hypothetical protein